MKQPNCSLAKTVSLCLGLALALVTAANAADPEMDYREQFNHQSQGGIRIGVWGNLGDKPSAFGTNDTSTYTTNIKNASFYFEAYFGYRLAPAFMLEFAFGIVNRGDITVVDNGDQFIGSLLVYPIQVRGKVYPLGAKALGVQPYLMAGGGLYYGRNSIQFASTSYYFNSFTGESQTDFNFMLGGGADWPLSHTVALDGNVSYMPINFSKGLISVKNYNAFTVTVGIKYLLPLKKNK